MHQCMSTGLSTASVSLYIGTTQSPVSSIVRAMAANRGSSSSQNGIGAKPTASVTAAATTTTTSGCRSVEPSPAVVGATGIGPLPERPLVVMWLFMGSGLGRAMPGGSPDSGRVGQRSDHRARGARRGGR